MKKIHEGSTVGIDYEGRTNGKLFDTSKEDIAKAEGIYQQEREYIPLHVTVGDKMLIKGFEDALIDMEEGQEKIVNIEAKDAYGEPREDLIKKFKKDPERDKDLQEGMLILVNVEGRQVPAQVKEVSDEITIDFNHPLAGKNLTFKIKVIKIEN